MKIFVFDLDDTLYDEMSYVKSGFNAVSAYLAQSYSLSREEVFNYMWQILLEKGRGQVFNEVLRCYGIFTSKEVRKCLSVYRRHIPNIKLHKDAQNILEQLREYPIYIVTDGNKLVQNNKLKALSLYNIVKKCYITHRYGRQHAKPSPYCFLQIAQKEKVTPSEIVYIGDNVTKDFVGIKPFGFYTVQICRGSYMDIVKPIEYQADRKVNSLIEILDLAKDIRMDGFA